MNVNQIRYFLDVAETGSINQSALNLYISPQGLSRSIAQLEKGLGFDLFARSNRGMVLTEEGRSFVEAAREMQKAYEKFEHEVSVISAHSVSWMQESLNLQIPPILAISDDLEKLLSLIGKRYPTLRIDVTERNSFDLVTYAQNLSDDQLRRTCMVATVPDYAVSSYLGEDRFTVTKIDEMPMMIRVEKSHPFAQRQSVSCAEIARERIVCFNEPVVEDIVHHLLDQYGGPNFAFKGSTRNLIGRFPDAVLISAGRSPYANSQDVVSIPIQDTVQVHIIAITAKPEPPLMRGIANCIAEVRRASRVNP